MPDPRRVSFVKDTSLKHPADVANNDVKLRFSGYYVGSLKM